MNKNDNPLLDQVVVEDICRRLRGNKRIQRRLPGDGFIKIDRQLPFLCVYRRFTGNNDSLTSRLIKSEASYLIMPANRFRAKYRTLIEQVVEEMNRAFGAFLLFEIWAGNEVVADESVDPEAVRPFFSVFSDTHGELISTSESLEQALRKIRILKKQSVVTLEYRRITRPAGMRPLLSKTRLLELKCYSLGLEVTPIYRKAETGEQYPLVFRSMHHGVSKAIKQALFEFIRSNTTHTPPHFHALGPRAVTKAVTEIDSQLAAISAKYDFLLLVTPINTRAGWAEFRKRGCERMPVLHYRPLPIDPAWLKRELYNINLDRVMDPTLAFLFQQKRNEMDRELTMLSERNTTKFLLGSIQLYGRVDEPLMFTALEILEALPGRSNDDTFSGRHSSTEFAELAQREISRFQHELGCEVQSRVLITDEVSGLMCSKGNVLVGSTVRIPGNRVQALLQHEVGTHILTYLNGTVQPLKLLAAGLNGYDELQEGIAVLAEYLVGQLSRARIRMLAGRVVAARYVEEGANFVETYRRLEEQHNFEPLTAYRITVRVHRGGGLTKDAIYLRGLIRLLSYLENGGDYNLLFAGKLAYEHIPTITELQHRGFLSSAKLLPSYFESGKALVRLKNVSAGMHPIQLVDQKKY
ncbi:flavohemoglobin expression-modulating QEGLA motif protein [Photobacterium sp. J15]|uniref:flavohemoglobin expression-modulating QEGLA motif protein n=1 Tax=Photobacterium sp. J15 TaxID=265901 RepID=UPI0007E4A4AE|nr:tyrosine/phenylalanine carboxypeptidase domain-containing protein [Photobacterium sp. J15]